MPKGSVRLESIKHLGQENQSYDFSGEGKVLLLCLSEKTGFDGICIRIWLFIIFLILYFLNCIWKWIAQTYMCSIQADQKIRDINIITQQSLTVQKNYLARLHMPVYCLLRPWHTQTLTHTHIVNGSISEQFIADVRSKTSKLASALSSSPWPAES